MRAASATAANGALPALTGARFFAAFAVVIYHYGSAPVAALSPGLSTLTSIGPAAVSFFYVLSGAVLTWGCTDQQGLPRRPAGVFWSQRAARILPAYLLALSLSVLPFALHAVQVGTPAGAALRVAAGVTACVLLLQAWLPPLAVGLNTPGWSISCETFFYLVFPRLVVALRGAGPGLPWRRGLLLWAGGLVAPALGLWALQRGLVPPGPFATLTEDQSGSELLLRLLSYFPALRLPEFALGVVVGHALRQTPASERDPRADTGRELVLTAVLLAAAWLLGSHVPGRLTGLVFADRVLIEGGLLAPVFALLVWQLARGDGLLRRSLSGKTAVLLGEASYALYIVQEPVLVWTTSVLKRLSPTAMSHWNLLFWVYAALLVGCSVLVHRAVELPLRLWLLPRLGRSRPAAAQA